MVQEESENSFAGRGTSMCKGWQTRVEEAGWETASNCVPGASASRGRHSRKKVSAARRGFCVLQRSLEVHI